MDNINCFKNFFKSIQSLRKLVFLMVLIKNDGDLLKECCYLKKHNNRLCLEFKNILMEQNEEYLDYIIHEQNCNIEKILKT